MDGRVVFTALIDQILVLLNPLVGFRFLGEGKKESVEFATRRLSGRVCRRVEGVVEELLEESSSLPLVVGGDGGGGGDLPVRIEPKMRKEEVCRFLDLQSGDVLGNEVFQEGSVHKPPGDLTLFVLGYLRRNVVDGTALAFPWWRGLAEAVAPGAAPSWGGAMADGVPSPFREQGFAVVQIWRSVRSGCIGRPPAE